VSDKLNEMWAALETHKPTPEYAEAWATMCRERTMKAAEAACRAAPAGSAVRAAAWWAAEAVWGAVDAATADRHAQRAIAAIAKATEVKP